MCVMVSIIYNVDAEQHQWQWCSHYSCYTFSIHLHTWMPWLRLTSAGAKSQESAVIRRPCPCHNLVTLPLSQSSWHYNKNMKKFIRKHSVGYNEYVGYCVANYFPLPQPPDIENTQQAPVSILKKSRLTDTSVRKSVIISEKREQDLIPNLSSDPDSEDSALCLEPEEIENDNGPGTQGSVGERERRKWVEKAVPMSNNPYTTENIVRRKRSSNNGDFVSMR